jgi:hypothetical protein
MKRIIAIVLILVFGMASIAWAGIEEDFLPIDTQDLADRYGLKSAEDNDEGMAWYWWALIGVAAAGGAAAALGGGGGGGGGGGSSGGTFSVSW